MCIFDFHTKITSHLKKFLSSDIFSKRKMLCPSSNIIMKKYLNASKN